MNDKRVIMTEQDIAAAVKRLAKEIMEVNSGIENLAIVGIQTRGIPLGKRIIAELLKLDRSSEEVPFGILDITLYRDDVDTMSTVPLVKETDIPFDISGKNIVIVDDVVFTGRSVRAAIDELIDFGRPKKIQLAVLVDRGHRELPIEPNFVGKRVDTKRDEVVKVELEETDGQDQVVLRKAVKSSRSKDL
jgi:pyrimidine operon attenuation protein/uracil phosphoribosyltransferase